MNNACRLILAAWVSVLTACGGGGGGTHVTHSTPMFGKLVSFTVVGPNLDKGITFTAPGCASVAEQAGGTATERVYTCKPSIVGNLTVTVTGGGTVLRTITVFVPQPQMTISTRINGVSQPGIVVELYPSNAPLSVNNILEYVNAGFYSNLIFHRVVPNFVVQGGGFSPEMVQASTRAPIKLEVPNGLSNLRGTVAMARTAEANSATSQFFINTADNLTLDTVGGGYAVFGKVISGMETVDAISAVPRSTVEGAEEEPAVTVLISSVTQTQ